MRDFSNFPETTLDLVGLRPNPIQDIIDEETAHFDSRPSVTEVNRIPDTFKIPLDKPLHWLKVRDAISCFVDMVGSTKLSASLHQSGTARAYRYFTNTAIRIYHVFGAAYIDIRGALAATVSVKTFVAQEFTPKLEKLTRLKIGGHFGIDKETVLVRKLGLRAVNRTDRQNEVWAGKPINMSAKLASRSSGGALWVSDRFYQSLKGERALKSCGCIFGRYTGEIGTLWTPIDVSDDERFDFAQAWVLRSDWCPTHGKEFCRDIIRYDA